MPYAPLSKQQQEQNQNQQPVNISGGGGANFSDVVPGQEKSQKSSGQYANLQQYVSANQPQAQQMGQKISSNLESEGQQAQQKVESFGQQKPSVAAFDPNQYIQNAPSLSQEQKSAYQTTKQTGGYTGPKSLEQASGYSEAQKAAQAASNKAKMAGNEAGQQELLKQNYARPDYTLGQTKLDQVLLKGNEQAKQGLSDLSQRYSGLYDTFNTKAEDVGAGINQANAQALANKQAILNAESGAWNELLNPLEQRAQQLNQQNPQIYQNIMSDISDDTLMQDTLNRLGLAADQNIYTTDLSSYLTPNQTQLGVNDVANAQERQKYQALASLFQDPSRTQIGESGFNSDPFNFNKSKFESDVAAKKAEYENAYANDRIFPGGATAKETEEFYIPRAEGWLAAAPQVRKEEFRRILETARQQLQNFKDQYGVNRQIKAGV